MYGKIRKLFQDKFQIENPDKIIMALVAILTFFDKEQVEQMITILSDYLEKLEQEG